MLRKQAALTKIGREEEGQIGPTLCYSLFSLKISFMLAMKENINFQKYNLHHSRHNYSHRRQHVYRQYVSIFLKVFIIDLTSLSDLQVPMDAYRETRNSRNRKYMEPTDPKPLWHMPRFSRHVRNHAKHCPRHA